MFRVELVCDRRALGCYSTRNTGPMATMQQDYSDAFRRMEGVEAVAITQGWVIEFGEAFCPACKILRSPR